MYHTTLLVGMSRSRKLGLSIPPTNGPSKVVSNLMDVALQEGTSPTGLCAGFWVNSWLTPFISMDYGEKYECDSDPTPWLPRGVNMCVEPKEAHPGVLERAQYDTGVHNSVLTHANASGRTRTHDGG